MTRRLRVVQLVQNLNYGGMERVLADLVRGLDPGHFENHVAVLQYLGRFAEGLQEVASLHQVPPLGRVSMVRPSVLADFLRVLAPDVVHSHSGVWYKAAVAARMAGVPTVIHTEHGRKRPDPWTDRVVDRAASGRNNGVVAVSAPLAHQLAAAVKVRCPIYLIPNGIDTDHYHPAPDDGELRRELGLTADVPVLGSIGRLEPIKGYDVMLHALAALPPGPVLVIGGDGSERERLGALAQQLGVSQRVHLLGWRDDTLGLLRAFSLFTMSSRSEGTSVSLLEAMSVGRCPVVTNVGGNAAVLGDDLRHRLVPPEAPAPLAAAWMAALANPAALARDGLAARQRVTNDFGARMMVARYARLYAGALDPWAPDGPGGRTSG